MFEQNSELQKGEAIEHAMGLFEGQPKTESETKITKKEAEKEND